MPLETEGFDGLMTDIAGMARRMDHGWRGRADSKSAYLKPRHSPSTSR